MTPVESIESKTVDHNKSQPKLLQSVQTRKVFAAGGGVNTVNISPTRNIKNETGGFTHI